MKKLEIIIFLLIIISVNFPHFYGGSIELMTYSWDAVFNGQLWRIFTHPFAHNSIYHMLIDSIAFFMLYLQLNEKSSLKRLAFIFSCGFFSLIAINFQLAQLNINTYCGLSGIDHGLMAILALEMIYYEKEMRKPGLIMLAILFGKCLFESITGKILFEQFHPGYVGIPITMSHTGGFIGGIVGFYLLNVKSITKSVHLAETTY